MKKIVIGILLILLGILFFTKNLSDNGPKTVMVPVWKFRSIDTVKYSRDLSREKINDINFDLVISKQVGDIAQTGASHIAIGTPYDEEFTPMLKRWVAAARNLYFSITVGTCFFFFLYSS